jgi:hypothetical protein
MCGVCANHGSKARSVSGGGGGAGVSSEGRGGEVTSNQPNAAQGKPRGKGRKMTPRGASAVG